MGKVRVQDLARMMGISNQDLVFKLKSIGVRVEGDDAHIDTDIITAILQGKKLPHPREVILRDEPAQPDAAARRRTPAPPPPTRRPAANPLRPQRPRTLIQSVEPRIQTLPAADRLHEAGHELVEGEETFLPPAEMGDEEMAAVAEDHAAPAVEPVEPPRPPEVVAAQAPVEAVAAAPVAAAPAAPPPAVVPPSPTAAPLAASAGPAGATAAADKPGAPAQRPLVSPSKRLAEGRMPARIISRPTSPQPPSPPPGQRPGGPSGPRPGGGPGGPRPGGPGGPRPGGPGGPRPSGPGGPRPGGPGGPRYGPGAGTGPSGPRPGGMGPRPSSGPGGFRPGTTPPPPTATDLQRRRDRAEEEQRAALEKKKKKAGTKKPGVRVPDAEDLKVYRGAISDIDGPDEVGGLPSARRHRRVLRKEDEDGQDGKLLTFKKDRPQGTITISEGMTLREFAEKLGVKVRDLIKTLFDRGIMANINQVVDTELAQKLARDMGVDTMVVSFEEEVQLREEAAAAGGSRPKSEGKVARAPVVTIMGHVDHGKTSLLDAIRSSKLTEKEFGGITQHIGAYHVDVHGKNIVFLDTPGHEAFTMMRARGAKVTDIVVLVVAADDGVMPQTIEAIDHARAAKVPIVVAINKIDKANANQDRVKRELSDRGLQSEEWGGDTVMVPLSALKREGIDNLLEMILLTADLLELKATPDLSAQATVLEARKDVGRGIVATVLVQNGALRGGDVFVSGATWGKVRSMTDDRGKKVTEAGPSTPVEVTGFSELPEAGDLFQVVEDEAQARGISEFRAQELRRKDLAATGRLSLAQLFDRIQEGVVKELAVVLKADVQGSLEVLRDTLVKVSTEKVKVQVLHTGVGAITTNDVLLASASKAIIVGFNVRPERAAAELAEKEGVEIRLHTVIYELLDELKKAMTGLLEPTFREVSTGRAEVRDTFKVPKIGTIAGCHVLDGVIHRIDSVRLLRDNRVVYEGKLASLKRFKDDASEVRAGFDCGIGLERFQDVKPGDVIEAYTREQVAPVL